MEVLLTTSDARVSFAYANGTLFAGETLQVTYTFLAFLNRVLRYCKGSGPGPLPLLT